MGEQPLSDREAVVMELQVRYEYLTSLLGVNPTARSVFRVLYLDNSGWTISALSRKMNCARSTVREIIKRNINYGTMRTQDGLVYITPWGSDLLVRVQRETFRIAFGHQVGFSEGLITIFRDAPGLSIDHQAATVCFDKKIPDFING